MLIWCFFVSLLLKIQTCLRPTMVDPVCRITNPTGLSSWSIMVVSTDVHLHSFLSPFSFVDCNRSLLDCVMLHCIDPSSISLSSNELATMGQYVPWLIRPLFGYSVTNQLPLVHWNWHLLCEWFPPNSILLLCNRSASICAYYCMSHIVFHLFPSLWTRFELWMVVYIDEDHFVTL